MGLNELLYMRNTLHKIPRVKISWSDGHEGSINAYMYSYVSKARSGNLAIETLYHIENTKC